MNFQLSPLVILLACCFAITPSGQAYADDTKASGAEGTEIASWAPIFSPKEISLVPSCEEKPVTCDELPSKKGYNGLSYKKATVFDGDGSTYIVTYPGRLGRIKTVYNSDGSITVHFEPNNSSDPQQDEMANVRVCHCKN